MCSLLLLPVAWVPVPFGFRWSLPADSRSYEGLGGGIAWALDPAFCEQLLPSFHEDAPTSRYYRFVDCDEIKDAFVRAMSTWAANHDFLNFKDVSSECAALGVGRACGLAELYIQATASSNGTEAAYVELRSWAYGSVTTAGVVDGFAFSLLAADLFFSRDDCWYMDSSFCSHFQHWKNSAAVMKALFVVFWTLAFCWLLLLALRIVRICARELRTDVKQLAGQKLSRRERNHAKYTSRALFSALTKIASWPFILALFFAMVPPLVYFRIYAPCVECYDFEAAIAHEIGHALGFDHPDQYADQNWKLSAPIDASTCADPEALVLQSQPVPDSDGGSESPHSIMFSLTTVRSQACLTVDDLEGLNFLYPTCAGARTQADDLLCVKAKRNHGWLRFLMVVLFPLGLALGGAHAMRFHTPTATPPVPALLARPPLSVRVVQWARSQCCSSNEVIGGICTICGGYCRRTTVAPPPATMQAMRQSQYQSSCTLSGATSRASQRATRPGGRAREA